MSGQFRQDYADAICNAFNQVTPFDMSQDELNKHLREIHIHFRSE